MTWAGTFKILFILYCVEAGVFLLLSPWSLRWDDTAARLPVAELAAFLLHPATRGAISGFGLVHLLWGAHDLDLWLMGRKRASMAAPTRAQPEGETLPAK